ncbi:hypothetical protein [Paenibacillus macquariensis]|uniref:Glycosaminoglycan attachment site n=1 Tax=Paenibacillus macquariensis TaxID=948756 RepID=A0ABY1KDP0_9BACL|nr:hypothetical protein [Paenibacillus macquariensis]OAB27369.1 hypothetical protein PMSM_25490 [Paenibacillus macquariensis subsp. macquariensis]SIR66293.1 hypothetical protein SAMN05421578_12920 [Paenibacillus macquariensis]
MRRITENRYGAYVFFTRDKEHELWYEEVEWYVNEFETLWGVIGLDRNDIDYYVVISKRDNNKHIRSCVNKVSFENVAAAREWLFVTVTDLENSSLNLRTGNSVNNIFDVTDNEETVDEYFNTIASSPTHSSAKNLINEIMPYFFDVDGNFIEQLKTQGFDARLWELYLFCYFNEEGFTINKQFNAPDFLVDNGLLDVAIEATVVSNKDNFRTSTHIPTKSQIDEQLENIMPIRWGSSLYSKLTHENKQRQRYWEYPHTTGKPFVIAIADFHEPLGMVWSMNSLLTYLYGFKYSHTYNKKGEMIIKPIRIEEHINGSKKIPSGFFNQKDAENISAVLHSASGTVTKFNRIGKQCGFDEGNTIMIRKGTEQNPDPNAAKGLKFSYLVTEENSETWSEGVSIFHNPYAKKPLPLNYFSNASQHYMDSNNMIVTVSSNCVVYSSVTDIISFFGDE